MTDLDSNNPDHVMRVTSQLSNGGSGQGLSYEGVKHMMRKGADHVLCNMCGNVVRRDHAITELRDVASGARTTSVHPNELNPHSEEYNPKNVAHMCFGCASKYGFRGMSPHMATNPPAGMYLGDSHQLRNCLGMGMPHQEYNHGD